MKIVNIVGARPQFIKYFPLQKAIELYKTNKIEDILIHTGQHYDYEMSEVFFNQLGIKKPKYHLGIGSGSHGEQTGKAIIEIEKVLKKEIPDFVIVYGDTNSTLSGALASAKIHIPVIHIESGLRSYNKKMPEEINRVLTDHISTLLICPTNQAVKNLKKEGFKNIIKQGELIGEREKINLNSLSESNPFVINCGDIMYDVLIESIKIAEKNKQILSKLSLLPKQYNLMTIHREENTKNKETFQDLINFINKNSDNKKVIFPAHPRTKKLIETEKIKIPEKIQIIEPVSYFDMLILLKNSNLLFTDSGGMQKEAYWLKIPCITLREETEWIETVKSGWNVLYKKYKGKHTPKKDISYFGDGKTAKRIFHILLNLVNT